MHNNTVNDRIYQKRSLSGSLTRFHVVLVSIAVCLDFVFRLFNTSRNVCLTGFSARMEYLKSNFMSMPCDSMRQKLFFVDFLRFVDISFHFVYIPRCVTHSVQMGSS